MSIFELFSRKKKAICKEQIRKVPDLGAEKSINKNECKKVSSEKRDVPVRLPSIDKVDVYVPSVIDRNVLVYKYWGVEFSPFESASSEVSLMIESKDWKLSLSKDGDDILLSHNGEKIGSLTGRKNMVIDWIDKNDPVRAWLNSFGKSGNTVFLAFYRDEQERLSKNHDFDIIKLTNYANNDAQFAMSGLEDGVKLDFDENYEYDAPEGTVWVSFGAPIGRLPKRFAKKYLENGAEAVFLDHIDYDIEKEKDVPYVIIFW